MFVVRLNINQAKFPTKEFYPFNLKIFQETRSIEFTTPVTFFAGENGSGKSTLLAAIARKKDIHIWNQQGFLPLTYNKYEDILYQCIGLEYTEDVCGAFFSAQSFKKYAEMVDEWAKADPQVLNYYGGESLAMQSHGQTNMQYFRNRFKVKGIYLLDEPEAALSPKSQIELLKIIEEATANENAQFIIATHSPLLLGYKGSKIYSFDSSPINTIEYEDTDYYKIYRNYFINRN